GFICTASCLRWSPKTLSISRPMLETATPSKLPARALSFTRSRAARSRCRITRRRPKPSRTPTCWSNWREGHMRPRSAPKLPLLVAHAAGAHLDRQGALSAAASQEFQNADHPHRDRQFRPYRGSGRSLLGRPDAALFGKLSHWWRAHARCADPCLRHSEESIGAG